MKFTDDNTDPHSFYRKLSESGTIEICVCPVLYGFRVRAGYTRMGIYELDYCAGNNTKDVELIYACVLGILSQATENEPNLFERFAVQRVKPMYNDLDCFSRLLTLAAYSYVTKVSLPDLHKLKEEYLKTLFT